MIAANWAPGECLGVLQTVFGPVIPAVEEVIARSRVPAVRWHLSFCKHLDNCYEGECKSTDLRCFREKAQRINTLHSRYPETECYLSPRLEYSEKNCSKVKAWFDTTTRAAPLCKPIQSPFQGCVLPGIPVEKHGNSPGNAAIVSNDGANYFDSNSVKYNQLGTIMNLKWTFRNNLSLSSIKPTDTQPPPKERPLTNRLGKQDLEQMQLMKLPLSHPAAPAFCSRFIGLKSGEIWKNHAEDYGAKNDARGNKPLLITTNKADRLPIYNQDGTRIACMKYYGPFNKLRRLYVGSCSGDHAVDLYHKAGDWIFVKDKDTCLTLPSIRRWGSFR